MTDTPFPPAFDPFNLMGETRARLGLGEDEATRALQALMPAFWAGLRHTAASPQGLSGLMGAFAPAMNPTSPAGWPGGFAVPGFGDPASAFLERLFPNDAIRKAVLDQVAATTGLRHDALAGMMPAAATLMMGQLARQFAVGPARDWLDAFMTGFARGRPKPTPTPMDMMEPFAQAMSAFFAGFTRTEPEPTSGATAHPADQNARSTDPTATEEAPLASPLGDFLAAGRSMQEGQIRAFEQLFDTLAPNPR